MSSNSQAVERADQLLKGLYQQAVDHGCDYSTESPDETCKDAMPFEEWCHGCTAQEAESLVRSLREELRSAVEIIRELRRKLALAGVEGSPPGIPTMQDRLDESKREREALEARVKALTAERDEAREQAHRLAIKAAEGERELPHIALTSASSLEAK